VKESSTALIRLIDLNTISDAQLTPFLAWLNPQEFARYQRFVRVERQRQFLVGRVLLRWSILRLLPVQLSQISLTERPENAPLLRIEGIDVVPEFSLSHTGNWVACACSQSARVGLDIEMLNAGRDLQAIARHTFPNEDLDWMQRQPDQVQAFYFLWSRREARYKLTQRHEKSDVEHCYEHPHGAISMVLMTQSPLSDQPLVDIVDWHSINASGVNSQIRASHAKLVVDQ